MKQKLLMALTAGVFTLTSSYALAKDGKIRVGVMTGPEHSIAETAKKIAKEKYNLEVELITFTDYVMPNAALHDKALDANAFQTEPYMDAQIQDRGYHDFIIVGHTFVYPLAAYTDKLTSKEEIADKARVAIPNDPSNQGRALLLLQAEGFITLKDPTDLNQTVLDIVENPKDLRIQTLDSNLLARTLDQVDFAVINNNFAAEAGLTIEKDAIFSEGKDSPYVNLIVAREDNKDDEDILNFVKAYNTDEVYETAKSQFEAVIKGW